MMLPLTKKHDVKPYYCMKKEQRPGGAVSVAERCRCMRGRLR